MFKRGHTVYHYGHPDSVVRCTKHIDVISRKTYDDHFKEKKWQDFLPQSIQNKLHEEFNLNAAREALNHRHDKNDLVLAFWGIGHQEACEKLKDSMIVVEPSIGYDSFFAHFRIFESYAHLHKMLGGAHQKHPSPTDHVIPPGFTPSDFEFSEKKEDYWLFLGRIVDAKGVHIADQLSRALRQPIKFVGPQTLKNTLPKDNPYAEYIPTVSHEQRRRLLTKAKGLLMPTLYMEPCGWSMIEAWFSGTPVLTTDWGAPAEYNRHHKTGFKCRSLNEFFHAANLIETISPRYCRQYAENQFHISHIMKRYETYFEFLINEKDYGFWENIYDQCSFTSDRFLV
jgi:glycosyltransferase involved in cell wall biosynthesis